MRLTGRILVGVAAVLLIITWALSAGAQQAPQSDPAKWSREQKTQFLLTAKIIRQRAASDGITGSLRATLQNELGTHDAHIQAIDEYKPRYETPLGTQINFKDTYKFNIAAYILDRILDLNLIPVTVERKVGGKTSAVTWWIDDVMTNERDRLKDKVTPPNPEKWNEAMYVVRVFDQLIANTDRNLGNIIITKNWDMWMIDHTRAFRTYHDLLEAKNLVKCDRALLQALRDLNKPVLKQQMGRYMTGMEIDGLLARRDKIVKFFDEKIAAEGENAVLYDYLVERRKMNP
jgi:hypothetical protein